MMSDKKDYIGRTLAGRPALVAPDRPALVGFVPVDKNNRLRSGAHFLLPDMKVCPEVECRWPHDVGLPLARAGPLDRAWSLEARAATHRREICAATTPARPRDIHGGRFDLLFSWIQMGMPTCLI